MSTPSTPEQGTPDSSAFLTHEGVHSVSFSQDVQVRLVPVPGNYDPQNGEWDYFVYLESEVGDEPDVGTDVELGTVSTEKDAGLWWVHLPPYDQGMATEVDDLASALNAILELSTKVGRRFGVDEDGDVFEIVDPPAPWADEEAEDAADAPAAEVDGTQDGNLRDHVPIGLDIPISVTRWSNSEEYYVMVKLPDGPSASIGLVEPTEFDGESPWTARAEPEFRPVVRANSMQEAIDALVRYAFGVNVELRDEMRTDEVTGERIV